MPDTLFTVHLAARVVPTAVAAVAAVFAGEGASC